MNDSSVAVLGTGIMGGAMARRLLAAELDVTVWNRTEAKAAARDAGLDATVIPAVSAALRRAVDLGRGDADMSAIYEAFRPR